MQGIGVSGTFLTYSILGLQTKMALQKQAFPIFLDVPTLCATPLTRHRDLNAKCFGSSLSPMMGVDLAVENLALY